MRRTARESGRPQLLIAEGQQQILGHESRLRELAARCGQAGAMHWLPYFLEKAAAYRRKPCLVMKTGAADRLEAAALLFEYTVCGVPTRAFTTGDAVGYSSVLAEPSQRMRFAAAAAGALVERGAQVVLTSFEGEAEGLPEHAFAGAPALRYATRQRSLQRTLALRGSLDETLAMLGKKTRFNLRYYRRRLEKEVGCEFMADAALSLRAADLKAINQGCMNPVDDAEFARRVRCASELPGSFLCGLRSRAGAWLSLVGGWRAAETTVLFWQMNTAGFERLSLGTAMRSYLLEDEIRRGAQQLVIYGGTPHSMRHAFAEQPLGDVIVRRRTLHGAALHLMMRRLVQREDPAGPRSNFLASTMHDPTLRWMPSQPARGRQALPMTNARQR